MANVTTTCAVDVETKSVFALHSNTLWTTTSASKRGILHAQHLHWVVHVRQEGLKAHSFGRRRRTLAWASKVTWCGDVGVSSSSSASEEEEIRSMTKADMFTVAGQWSPPTCHCLCVGKWQVARTRKEREKAFGTNEFYNNEKKRSRWSWHDKNRHRKEWLVRQYE